MTAMPNHHMWLWFCTLLAVVEPHNKELQLYSPLNTGYKQNHFMHQLTSLVTADAGIHYNAEPQGWPVALVNSCVGLVQPSPPIMMVRL